MKKLFIAMLCAAVAGCLMSVDAQQNRNGQQRAPFRMQPTAGFQAPATSGLSLSTLTETVSNWEEARIPQDLSSKVRVIRNENDIANRLSQLRANRIIMGQEVEYSLKAKDGRTTLKATNGKINIEFETDAAKNAFLKTVTAEGYVLKNGKYVVPGNMERCGRIGTTISVNGNNVEIKSL